MALQAFSFPLPETRFFKAGSFIYKFKIRGGTSYREEDAVEENISQELENIIRTVLGNLDNLQPFSSTHFTVFPYKKRWKNECKHYEKNEKNLQFYPFVLTLYLEKNMQDDEDDHTSAGRQTEEDKKVTQYNPSVSEPKSKRYRRDSPLEDAIIKALIQDMKAEGKVIVTGKVDHQYSEVRGAPGYSDKKAAKQTDKPQQKQCVSEVSGNGTAGEMHHGTRQSEEEETPATPTAKPGILRRLASHIFPFLLKKY